MFNAFRNKDHTFRSKLGFEKDQDGILKRYLGETDAWAPHLDRTKAAVMDQSATKSKTKAAILGSGWLLDIPLDELASLFSELWLFDIRHPFQIKKQVSKHNNVKLVETDISGLALSISNLAHKKSPEISLSSLIPAFDFDLSEFDYIVSCNLLNQLDIILMDYLSEHIRITTEEEIMLRRHIQQTHLQLLPPNKSCLIADTEEIWLNKKNEMSGKKQLIFTDLPEKGVLDQWIWYFDNHYTYHPHCKTWLKVSAIQL